MSLMIDRIRKGHKAHVYLREWRKHLRIRAVDMAERLEIERESYYRLERDPDPLSVAEVAEIADMMGIDPPRLWEPPPAAGTVPRVSLDAIAKDATEDQLEGLAAMLRKVVGSKS